MADNSFGDQQQIEKYAAKFSAEDLQLNYQICLKGKSDIALSIDQRAMFEMLLIRMLVFSPNGIPAIPVGKDVKPPVKTKESDSADLSDETIENSTAQKSKQEKKKETKL